MPLSEFDIIARYFQQAGLCADVTHANIPLGIGDDCALLTVPTGYQMAVSMDVLVATVHFPLEANPALLAQRALAVNLSDLAAMGASPIGFTLGLTLPCAEESWLADFSQGLRLSAQKYGCPLFGGNLTRGPLQICIQVHGLVQTGKALLRSGAKPGDSVYVSGTTGRAGLALDWIGGALTTATQEQIRELEAAYYLPEPRLKLGQALQGIASSAQDISDGLLADLGHIARQSDVQIVIEADVIPLATVLLDFKSYEQALLLALTAGDDYELIFTAPLNRHEDVISAAVSSGVNVTRIGSVSAGSGTLVLDAAGKSVQINEKGYDHFGIKP
ncbi:MAG: thiamine-phosphate kinase [Pseudomonadota bacterium]